MIDSIVNFEFSKTVIEKSADKGYLVARPTQGAERILKRGVVLTPLSFVSVPLFRDGLPVPIYVRGVGFATPTIHSLARRLCLLVRVVQKCTDFYAAVF